MLKEAKSYNHWFGDKDKNIDKSKYEYRIEISGRVSEYVCGSIKDDVWNYIKAEFNGDAKAYCEALDHEKCLRNLSLVMYLISSMKMIICFIYMV